MNHRIVENPMLIAAMLVVAIVCVGCWEEIRSQPRPETIEAVSGAPASVEGAAEAPSAPKEPAADPVGSTQLEPSEPAAQEDVAPLAPAGNEPVEKHNDDPFSLLPPEEETASPEPPLEEVETEATPVETPSTQSPVSTENSPAIDPFEQSDNSPPTAEDRRRVWEAASKWSLASAIYAKGLASKRYEPIFKEAEDAAAAIGVSLPPLPTGDDANREALVIESLQGEPAAELVRGIGERFTPEEAAAAELAFGTQVLLLTYSPRSDATKAHAESMRRAAEASGLPAELWQPLLKRLDDRAPFIVVRLAVFDFHRRTAKHLAGK
jgi:hypothetical protein